MSEKPQFTTGEWVIEDRGAPNLIEIVTYDGDADDCGRSRFYRTEVATVADTEDQEANARLIAAAPEMFEALAKHQAFFDKLAAHCFGSDASEGGSDLEYSEFLELAESAGLLRVEGYDPDKHGHGADSAPGDTWYVPSRVGSAALAKALGEVVPS